MDNLEIKMITIDKVISTIKMVWDIMLEFDQINDCFKNEPKAKNIFIEAVVDDYLDEELLLIGAFIDKQIVGVIGSKENYINFFFVKKEYQNQKIGKSLMQVYLDSQKLKFNGKIEVDSSIYAHDIYKHLGFVDVEEYSEKDEYPMVYELRRD